MTPLAFDDHRTASLDGTWEFFPGDHQLDALDGLEPVSIGVPGLWEAQGHLDLDGRAWYRRQFDLDDVSGGWTLRFGAVMDFFDVYVNGNWVGDHDQPFLPAELDVAAALRYGRNQLAVRVFDPSLADFDHPRMAHGKQGWANHVFPSRPSLYMTYGGIWQPVTLHRHGPVVVGDVFVNGDPDNLVATALVHNRGATVDARVGFRTLGTAREETVRLGEGETATVRVEFGAVTATRWAPQRPALHHLAVEGWADTQFSDSRAVRYGLRTVEIAGKRMLVNGAPYRMKSVLVQGFTPDRLYAEGRTEEIHAEVRAAQAMGFNTLRLHIKAFDPRYLDACDELGMMLHCDIPVAEPIAHEEMGDDSLLVRRCVAAARGQVRRDRNHPSIVLWSAMNEICDGRREARRWPEYESFARALYAAVRAEDSTRPVIENDWVEPDPDEVFESPILTAHWYGRLHRDYLDKLEAAAERWSHQDRLLFVTEYGDWGLPEMPPLADPPFWDTRAVYAAGLADTLWPASVGRFLIETQRYQGLSDRMQTEVFRRYDDIAGYCLTELTDVPIELNGLLDLQRRPKPLAVAEMTRANQVVLPMLDLHSLVAVADAEIRAQLHVANDGPPLSDVRVAVRFGDTAPAVDIEQLLAGAGADLPAEQIEDRFRETEWETHAPEMPGDTTVALGEVAIMTPDVPGNHDLVLRVHAGGVHVAENRYNIHVVPPARAPFGFRVIGTDAGVTGSALRALGASIHETGPAIVPEGGLDARGCKEAAELLATGGVVLVLAQDESAATHYPVPVSLEGLTTAWGSTVFGFTIDHGALPTLPRRNVLTTEDSTVSARSAVSRIDGRPFPDTPVVIAYKPVPNAVTGTVIGSHAVGAGRLVICQYRLTHAVTEGDPAAQGMFADLLRWVALPRPVQTRERLTRPDGRALLSYSWRPDVAR